MADDDDWDLYAVVRGGCRSATTTALETTSTIFSTSSSTTTTLPLKEEEIDDPLLFSSSFPNNVIQPNGFQELHQFFMPFVPTNTSTTTSGCNRSIYPNSSSPFPDISGAIGSINIIMPEASSTFGYEEIFPDQLVQQKQNQNQQLQIVQQQKFQDDRQIIISNHNNNNSAMTFPNMQGAQTPTRSRKRKSQQKRMVCHVTAENLSADLWAWRKYGQKPIKGSPFPRNYYRCSSSKGCGARKQVEKSNTEPDMFIVTYTGDHTHPRPTHRNSLAGSTRNNKPTVARQPGSPTTPLTAATAAAEDCADDPIVNNNNNNNEIMDMGSDDDDEEILIPNMAVMIENNVFLDGANQIDGGGGGGTAAGGDYPANDSSLNTQTGGLTPVQLNQVSHLGRSSPG